MKNLWIPHTPPTDAQVWRSVEVAGGTAVMSAPWRQSRLHSCVLVCPQPLPILTCWRETDPCVFGGMCVMERGGFYTP